MNPEVYYSERKKIFEEKLQSLKSKIIVVSLLRILSIVFCVLSIVFTVRLDQPLLFIATGLLIALFFLLVNLFLKLQYEKKKLIALIKINRNELEAFKGNISSFAHGKEFLDQEHEFTYDLDIFGENSLFQYLNRSITLDGSGKLAEKMLSTPHNKDEIITNQKITKELSAKPDFLQDFLSTGMLTEDKAEDQKEISSWLKSEPFRFGLPIKVYTIVFSLLNLVIFFRAFMDPETFSLLLITVSSNFLVYGFYLRRINKYHDQISKKQNILIKYLHLNKIILNTDFHHPRLLALEKRCKDSFAKVQSLKKLINAFDFRLNMLMGAILNGLFLFDFHCIQRLESWKKKGKENMLEFFNTTAEFDAMISMSVFRFNHPKFCTPEFSDKIISARELGHPLINEATRINNDFEVKDDQRVLIVTGANMAGKSTLLRTLGVNLVLAGMGLPVCAAEMSFKPVKIITGMRTTDSLADSESYFFAELKRLRKVIDSLQRNEKIFVLLDEILKGTNSIDKHEGSYAFIEKFVQYEATAIIATHDLELGVLEEKFPKKVINYSFESYVKNEELEFDYKLNRGVAKNMNASFLMRKMGIIQRK